MQVAEGVTTIDKLAHELSRVTSIFEHFLRDVEVNREIPTRLRTIALTARMELDGQPVER